MPEVRFYTGLADRTDFSARLLRKGLRLGLKVWVAGREPDLQRLSEHLWSLPGFQAHADSGAVESVRVRSPVRLSAGFDADADCDTLLNLTDRLPPELNRWRLVLELVGESQEEIAGGRSRYAAYRRLGMQPQHLSAEGR